MTVRRQTASAASLFKQTFSRFATGGRGLRSQSVFNCSQSDPLAVAHRFGYCASVKFSRYLLGLAVLAGIYSIVGVGRLIAQSSILEANRHIVSSGIPAQPPGAQKLRRLPLEATAFIDFGNAQSITAFCHKGSFDRVGLRHDQTVDIVVQYSTATAGAPVTVVPLDGGAIVASGKDLVVAADGTIHFKFRAGHQPGTYQIALHNGGQEVGLQFWVVDDEHPGNNPVAINPGN
jgi:hypothetical protein